jgi:hypothetical protein
MVSYNLVENRFFHSVKRNPLRIDDQVGAIATHAEAVGNFQFDGLGILVTIYFINQDFEAFEQFIGTPAHVAILPSAQHDSFALGRVGGHGDT